MVTDDEPDCTHPEVEYDEGNYVPPFGWELHPGWFCVDCSEELPQEDIEERGL